MNESEKEGSEQDYKDLMHILPKLESMAFPLTNSIVMVIHEPVMLKVCLGQVFDTSAFAAPVTRYIRINRVSNSEWEVE